jgi:predicted anti-sigma-YlaC factor YlaD
MSDEHPMTCDEALRLLAVFLDGELHGPPHAAVEQHLEVCRACYSRAEFERRLKAEVGRLRREEVSSGFAARVRGILDSFTSSAAERADRP